MKRTTISLPEELAGRLEREARRRGLSVSEVAREALSAHFGMGRDEPRHLPFEALGRSGHHNTARDFEEILAKEWDADRDR